jgi:predicted Zn-dependent protease
VTPRTIWIRRAALMAIVGLLVAIPVTLLIRGGDDEGGTPTSPVTTAAEQPEPELGPDASDPGLDVTYRVPKGWKESKQASAIRITAPDKTAELVLAAPGPADDADEVLDEALEAFRVAYEDVDVAPGSGRKVGGLEAKGAVVSAKQGDRELRIVVAVAEGEERAYLVEVFTISGLGPERLRETQVALNSIRFDG